MVVLECERVDRSKLSTENIRRATNRRRRPSYLLEKNNKLKTNKIAKRKEIKALLNGGQHVSITKQSKKKKNNNNNGRKDKNTYLDMERKHCTAAR